ncbi:MAG: dihydroorotase [Candidatus Helarchaeota archaeon]
MIDLILTNAKIYTAGSIKEGAIAIDAGKIQNLGKESNLPSASKKIDCNGNLIFPGLIDVHVHLRDLELSYKEDFFTGTSAALAGGVTTVLDMPNTKPRTDKPEILKTKMEKATKKIVCNVGFYSAIPKDFKNILKLKDLGIFGFKIYPDHPYSNFDFADNEQLHTLIEKLSKTNLPIVVHPEQKNTRFKIEEYIKKNRSDIDAFLKAHNNLCEVSTIIRCINILQGTNAKLHFAHVSTSESVKSIIDARTNDILFTSETTPHHLLLNLKSLESNGAISKMVPPLRRKVDTEALWRGLNSGFIDILATDHAPHSIEEKNSGFLNAPSGVPGLESCLPLMLTCISKEKITLKRFIEIYSENPAKIFQIERKGKIKVGYDADLVIIDLKRKFKINPKNFLSKAQYSPFEGFNVQGKPIMTILAGEIAMDNGEIVTKEGSGSLLKTKRN